LALALAVPALGGPSNPVASVSASVKKIANKALKTAKSAQTTANTALNEAKTAQSSASSAKAIAEAAKAAAAAAEANANSRVKGISETFGTATAENNVTPKSTSAHCEHEEEEEVTGGGFSMAGSGSNQVTIVHSEPVFPIYGRGWFVEGKAITGTPTWELQAVAFCAHK
jgi:hypothetical protein